MQELIILFRLLLYCLIFLSMFVLPCIQQITIYVYVDCRKTKASEDPVLDLLSYRREVVKTYISCYSQPRPTAGRVRGTVLPADRRVSNDVRMDHLDHYQKPYATQKRCGVCHKNTRKGCFKCGVGLHDHCFEKWHGLQ